jgi:hypothetical protein
MNMRKHSLWIVLFLFFALNLAQAQTEAWLVWENKDIASLSNDNTGTSFALSGDVQTADGLESLEVTPSGSAEETKLALAVNGADLEVWTGQEQLTLEVYLPEENAMNPNAFFLGMADVGGNWTWLDGVFGDAQLRSGWNQVVYTLSSPMRAIENDAQYMLYFSFFNENAGSKTPLSEAFYLGHAYFGSQEATGSSNYQDEVEALLRMDDAALLDAVARASFDFFWLEANPENGLIKDRSTAESPSSIAAVGFGLAAIPIGIDRGWISHEEGYARTLTTLETFANGGVEGEHGFFYHFVDMQTGERVWESELSSIDTALFIIGALTAAEYFPDTEVETLANQLYEAIDWQWMMNERNMVSMGWKPDEGFFSATWDHFDESILLYVLAIASPSHPAPVSMWAEMRRPVDRVLEYIYLPSEPLFVYQYPHAFLDLRDKEDAFANYFNNTRIACERNRNFSINHAEDFETYQNGVWGISASDGPEGYRAYGAAEGYHDGTIAPYASISCLPFTPEYAFESMRAMLSNYGSQAWREYGFVSAINAEENWYSTEHIGIDEGDTLLMIANYQDEFVWNLFMQNETIQQALLDIGFVESQGDYAVTPAYLEASR